MFDYIFVCYCFFDVYNALFINKYEQIKNTWKAIQKYKKPLLVIHSTEDTRVKYKHGKRIFNKANEPKTFLTIDQKHIRGPLFYPQEIVSEMKKLLAD